MISDPEQLKRIALGYHAIGLGVLKVYLPVKGGCSCDRGSECKSPGKHPLGGPYATLSADQIELTEWSDWNIGLAPTGEQPNFFVLDIDNKPGQGGGANLRAWVEEFGGLPKTPTARTGSGLHFYMKHPNFKLSNKVCLASGIDVRARGGFVVAPPSIHASGNAYEWLVSPETPLAEAPEWLLNKLKPKESNKPEKLTAQIEADVLLDIPLDVRKKRAKQYLKAIPPAVEGEGGDAQTLAACSVGYSFGITEDDFFPMIQEYNARCKPPWNSDGLRTKLTNAYKYNELDFGWRLLEGLEQIKEERAEIVASGKSVFADGGAGELSKWFLADNKAPDYLRSTGDGFFVYDPSLGTWRAMTIQSARSRVQSLDGSVILSDSGARSVLKMTPRKRDDACNLAIHDASILDLDFLIDPPAGAVFNDGFITVSDGNVSTSKHCHTHRATCGFPFEIKKSGDPSRWVDFMRGLFIDDTDADEKIAAIQEFLGVCILGIAPQYSRCLMLTGEGDNGKSTLMELIEAIFPPEMRSSSSPKSWEGHSGQYYLANLRGIRLNLVSEIPEKLLASDRFKQVITGESLTAREPYGKPITFTPQSGHMFAANQLPATLDNSKGFWRRFLVLSFNRNFKDLPEGEFKTKEEIIRSFKDQKSTIASWALKGAQRIIGRKQYTLPASHYETLGAWRKSADAVADFVASCCVVGQRGSLRDLYKAFRLWAHNEGRAGLGKHKFSERLVFVPDVVRLVRDALGVAYNIKVKDMGEWSDYSGPRLMGGL